MVWLLAYANQAKRLCVEGLLSGGTGLSVGLWFRLLRQLGFTMKGWRCLAARSYCRIEGWFVRVG